MAIYNEINSDVFLAWIEIQEQNEKTRKMVYLTKEDTPRAFELRNDIPALKIPIVQLNKKFNFIRWCTGHDV
jgi:hypothetical protein